MKINLSRWIVVLAAIGLSGCASLETSYLPTAVGMNSIAQEVNGLRISIRPETDTVEFGKKLSFNLLAHNVSDKPFLLPRDPDMLFCWVYPTGRRDNYLIDMKPSRHYGLSDLVRVEPGQAIRFTKSIDTYYFPKRGVTEFYAVFHTPRNTNPEIDGVWVGEAESNRYGVLVDKASRIAAYTASHPDGHAALAPNRTDS